MRPLQPLVVHRRSRASLLLLFVAVAASAALCSAHERRHSQQLVALDAELADALAQVVSEQETLLQRLEHSRELVERLFAREADETRGFVLKTRGKMRAMGDALREEMRLAMEEVQGMLQDAARNATGEIHRHEVMKKQQREERQRQQRAARNCASVITPEQREEVESIADEAVDLQPAALGWHELVETLDAIVLRCYEALTGVSRLLVGVVSLCAGILASWLHVLVWQILPLAAVLLAVLVLGMVVVAWIHEYKRARHRRPRVVYSEYLHARTKAEGAKQNGKVRKLKRTRGDASSVRQVKQDKDA